jgi:hypothetical protein
VKTNIWRSCDFVSRNYFRENRAVKVVWRDIFGTLKRKNEKCVISNFLTSSQKNTKLLVLNAKNGRSILHTIVDDAIMTPMSLLHRRFI